MLNDIIRYLESLGYEFLPRDTIMGSVALCDNLIYIRLEERKLDSNSIITFSFCSVDSFDRWNNMNLFFEIKLSSLTFSIKYEIKERIDAMKYLIELIPVEYFRFPNFKLEL